MLADLVISLVRHTAVDLARVELAEVDHENAKVPSRGVAVLHRACVASWTCIG